MIYSKYYIGSPGNTHITDSALIGSTILRLCRSGIGFEYTAGSPGNREFKFTNGSGRVDFETAFSDVPFDPLLGAFDYSQAETIMIKFKK